MTRVRLACDEHHAVFSKEAVVVAIVDERHHEVFGIGALGKIGAQRRGVVDARQTDAGLRTHRADDQRFGDGTFEQHRRRHTLDRRRDDRWRGGETCGDLRSPNSRDGFGCVDGFATGALGEGAREPQRVRGAVGFGDRVEEHVVWRQRFIGERGIGIVDIVAVQRHAIRVDDQFQRRVRFPLRDARECEHRQLSRFAFCGQRDDARRAQRHAQVRDRRLRLTEHLFDFVEAQVRIACGRIAAQHGVGQRAQRFDLARRLGAGHVRPYCQTLLSRTFPESLSYIWASAISSWLGN